MGKIRAIGIFSGGLDSLLSIRILQLQDVDVTGICFVTPFFGPEAALRGRDILGIPLLIEEITDAYMRKVLANPRYGFGKNMNPCVDCHAFMFHLAGKRMEEEGAHFLFSGEVLGQRPFSQNRGSLNSVSNLSGYPDSILRPLSARRLPETRMEREGWVDRARLMDFQGRSRKPQMELAERFGIAGYPKPAGGCLLTEPNFSRRLRDLLKYDPDPATRDLEMLKVGRHLRYDEVSRIVVGRRQEENKRLEELWQPGDLRLWVKGIPGPTVVMRSVSGPSGDAVLFAAQLAVRYSDAGPGEEVEVATTDGTREEVLRAVACDEEEIQARML
jgi:tRNA-specific 2-thiouridylase